MFGVGGRFSDRPLCFTGGRAPAAKGQPPGEWGRFLIEWVLGSL